jgi:formylmethanofuran:tetrahydromethanopterin formyltransferase
MSMTINGVAVDDTFAEAFGMSGTGIIITASSRPTLSNVAAAGVLCPGGGYPSID